jgi:hypothetical protein
MTSKPTSSPLIGLASRKPWDVSFQTSGSARIKRFKERFQLIGITFGGRRLKIIFSLKPNNVVRIITGWQL